jgi:hypothetical protein
VVQALGRLGRLLLPGRARQHNIMDGAIATALGTGLVVVAGAAVVWLAGWGSALGDAVFSGILPAIGTFLSSPVTMPLWIAALPVLAMVLLGFVCIKMVLAIAPEGLGLRVTIGGWVPHGNLAYKVSEKHYPGGRTLKEDGPFCAACKVRMMVGGSAYVTVYQCLTTDCHVKGDFSYKPVDIARQYALAQVEARISREAARGRDVVINPDLPLVDAVV